MEYATSTLFVMLPSTTIARKIGVNQAGTISPMVSCGSVMSIAVAATTPRVPMSTAGTKPPSAVHQATARFDVSCGR